MIIDDNAHYPCNPDEKPRVLCVDDEPAILDGLELTLRHAYKVIKAKGGREGLVALQAHGPIAVVVADMVMPEMDGAAFLAEAARMTPDTTRILLTGHADVSAAIAAVNRGRIFRFLTKPCPPQELLEAVAVGVSLFAAVVAERKRIEDALRSQAQDLQRMNRHLGCLYDLSKALDVLARRECLLTDELLAPFLNAIERDQPVAVKLELGTEAVASVPDAMRPDVVIPVMSGGEACGAVSIGRHPAADVVVISDDETALLNEMADRLAVHAAGVDALRIACDRQRQLMQADKLASLGVMVAGVAHEINNPVNNIMLNASLLSDVMPEMLSVLDRHYALEKNGELGGLSYTEMRDCMPQMLQDMIESCERIKAITEDLRVATPLDYEKRYERIDVNAVVRRSIRLCSHIGKGFTERMRLSLADDLPRVACSRRRLEQAVINLLQNAWQGLDGESGGIDVATTYDAGAGMLCLCVHDEGRGMHPDALARVKDPFFTTRRDQGGTGLGGFIANSIIDEMGGRLDYESKLGEGTSARIWLPVGE